MKRCTSSFNCVQPYLGWVLGTRHVRRPSVDSTSTPPPVTRSESRVGREDPCRRCLLKGRPSVGRVPEETRRRDGVDVVGGRREGRRRYGSVKGRRQTEGVLRHSQPTLGQEHDPSQAGPRRGLVLVTSPKVPHLR